MSVEVCYFTTQYKNTCETGTKCTDRPLLYRTARQTRRSGCRKARRFLSQPHFPTL